MGLMKGNSKSTRSPKAQTAVESTVKKPVSPTGRVKNGGVSFFSKSKNLDARFLSNFASSSIFIGEDFVVEELRNETAPNVEAAFQAAKIVKAGGDSSQVSDRVSAAKRLLQPGFSAVEAKRCGSKSGFKSKGFTYNHEIWTDISHKVMSQLLRYRAKSDGRFRQLLVRNARMGLKHYHFERSGSKSEWGGHFEKDTGEWQGNNRLGRMIDALATELAAASGA